MDKYTAAIDEIVEEVNAHFDAYAAEHGPTEVIMKSTQIRVRYGVNGTVASQALKAAGFWVGKDIRWRKMYGVNRLEFGGESTLDEVMT